jgi:hypothetical protein
MFTGLNFKFLLGSAPAGGAGPAAALHSQGIRLHTHHTGLNSKCYTGWNPKLFYSDPHLLVVRVGQRRAVAKAKSLQPPPCITLPHPKFYLFEFKVYTCLNSNFILDKFTVSTRICTCWWCQDLVNPTNSTAHASYWF